MKIIVVKDEMFAYIMELALKNILFMWFQLENALSFVELSKSCFMNHSNDLYILMSDPFNLDDFKRNSKKIETIKRAIAIMIVMKYAYKLIINLKTLSDEVYNYIGNGKIFNLQNNQIIIRNNISIELTTNQLEILKLLYFDKHNNNKQKQMKP